MSPFEHTAYIVVLHPPDKGATVNVVGMHDDLRGLFASLCHTLMIDDVLSYQDMNSALKSAFMNSLQLRKL